MSYSYIIKRTAISIITAVVSLLYCGVAYGQGEVLLKAPAIKAEITQESFSSAQSHTIDTANYTSVLPKNENIFKQFINQLLGGHKDRTFEKPIDFSFAVLPSYAREASFGIGGMVSGLYRVDRTDSITPPSDVQFFANVSLTGQYSFIFKGNHLFRYNKSRFTYDLAFQNKPLDFWGISYDACNTNPKSRYTRRHIKLESDYVYNITSKFYVGAALNMRYTFISSIDNPSYLEGQKESYFFTGIGASLCYDTRDFIPNPKRGIHLLIKEVVYPKFLCTTGQNIFSTTLIFNYYQKMWKGSVLAFDLYGQYNGEDVAWPLRPEVGAGGMRMRGYYGGRYIDNNMMSAQMEVRQHVYKRFGVAAWVGCGTVFPSFKELKGEDLLINYGIGLRFEFKHNVNLRVDWGFGRGTNGIVFGMAEAF